MMSIIKLHKRWQNMDLFTPKMQFLSNFNVVINNNNCHICIIALLTMFIATFENNLQQVIITSV